MSRVEISKGTGVEFRAESGERGVGGHGLPCTPGIPLFRVVQQKTAMIEFIHNVFESTFKF